MIFRRQKMIRLFFIGIILILSSLSVFCQSLKIENINSDGYPNILVEFKVFDKDSNEVRSFSVNDFDLLEGSLQRIISSIICPPTNQTKFSLILTIDISASMSEPSIIPGKTKMDVVREAARNAIKSLPTDSNRWEAAITLFDFTNELVRSFTNSKWWLLKGLDTFILAPRSGTDYNAGFLYDVSIPPKPGALLIAREARYKPVVIFLTDGKHEGRENPPPSRARVWVNQILDTAFKYDVTIYAITLGFPVPAELNSICSGTSYGQAYQSVPSQEELNDLYGTILNTIGTIGVPPPCRLRFNSDCDGGNIRLIYKPFNVSETKDYSVNPSILPVLDVSPSILSFLNLTNQEEISLKIVANNNKVDFIPPGIVSPLGNVIVTDWGGSSPPFTLERDSFRIIKIQFTPFQDNEFHTFSFTFQSSACSGNEVAVVAGRIFPIDVNCGSEIVGNTKNLSQVPIFCNNWNEPITIYSVRISGGNQSDFKLIGQTTNITLQPQTCLPFDISFTPSQPTIRESFIIFDTQKGRFESRIFGNGSGTPEITTVTKVNFLDVDCKYSFRDTTIQIYNSGVLSLEINSFSITGTNANSFEFIPANPNQISIPPNDSYQVKIRFNPNIDGINSANLEIISNASNSPNLSIPLLGFKANRNFNVNNSSIDFGTICPNEEANKTLTINSSGNVEIELFLTSSSGFSIVNSSPISIPQSSSTNVQIRVVSPTEGNFSGVLKIFDPYCNNEITLPLTVNVLAPKIDRTPIPITGNVGLSKDTTITIINPSSRALTVFSAYFRDPQIEIISPSLPWTIPPMSTINVDIRYTPTSGGIFSTFLVLEGEPCNFIDSIQFSSNPIASRADITIGNYKGLVGETIVIPIEIRNGILLNLSGTTKVRTQLSYDETMLKFLNVTPNVVFYQQPNLLTFEQIPFDPLSSTLLRISFEVLNSKNQMTPLQPMNTTAIDGFIRFNEISGSFEILPSFAEISVGNVEAKTGEEFVLPIYLHNLINVTNFHQSISTELTFNSSLMEPISPTPLGTVTEQVTTIKIDDLPIFPLDMNDSSIAKLRFRAKLGTAETTDIIISNTKTKEGYVRFSEKSGKLSITNICQSGGPRLFDPWGTFSLLKVKVISQSNNISLAFNPIEKGKHFFSIYNLEGQIIAHYEINFQSLSEANFNIITNLQNEGVYLVVVITPSQVLSEKFVFLR